MAIFKEEWVVVTECYIPTDKKNKDGSIAFSKQVGMRRQPPLVEVIYNKIWRFIKCLW